VPGWLITATRRLEPLEDSELTRIVDELVELSPEARAILVEKARGNPKELFSLLYKMRRAGQVVPAWPRWLEAPVEWETPTDRNAVFQPLQSVDIPLFDDDDLY
jgi:hypothetical protein